MASGMAPGDNNAWRMARRYGVTRKSKISIGKTRSARRGVARVSKQSGRSGIARSLRIAPRGSANRDMAAAKALALSCVIISLARVRASWRHQSAWRRARHISSKYGVISAAC